MIELFAMWQKEDKNGNVYFTGTLGKAQVKVFKNKHKKEAKHPDFIVYLDEQQRRDNPAPGPGSYNTGQNSSSRDRLPGY